MSEPQSRRACDRCHAQKLCCKREGNDSCLRCVKANVNCIFSPSLRSRKAQSRQNKDTQLAPYVRSRGSREGSVSDTQNVAQQRVRPSQAGSKGRPRTSSRAVSTDSMHNNMELASMDWQLAHDPHGDAMTDNSHLDNVDFGLGWDEQSTLERPSGAHLMYTDAMMASLHETLTNTPGLVDDITGSLTETSSSGASSALGNPFGDLSQGPGTNSAPSIGMPQTSSLSPTDFNSANAVGWPTVLKQTFSEVPRTRTGSPSTATTANFEPSSYDSAGSITEATWLQKVAEINVRLFEHGSIIPAVQEPHEHPQTGEKRMEFSENLINTPDQKGGGGSYKDGEGNEFAIDQTFLLSRQLIDILNQVYPRFHQRASPFEQAIISPTHSHSPHCQHSSHCGHSNSGSNPLLQSDQPPSSIDPGSGLLVLSCYLRVIDIYDKIFAHVRMCVAKTGTTGPLTQIRLPGLTIGSFSLQSTSALQVTLFIQLAEQLLDRLRSIVALMESTTRPNPEDEARSNRQDSTSLSDVTDVTLQAIRVREGEMVKRMNSVRRMLQQSGIM